MKAKGIAWLGGISLGLLFSAARPSHGVWPDDFERRDFALTTSTYTPLTPPGTHTRLLFDFQNTTAFYDYESDGFSRFIDGTWLTDTLKPVLTILWDERFRTQLGVVMRKTYGEREGIGTVDPWVQFLWQPIQPLSIRLGNLETPHAFHEALFLPLHYAINSPVETGVQGLFKTENVSDDFYFNYRLEDIPEHNEKFDLGFVHQNAWKFLRFNYQMHWIHEGGTLQPHPIATVNDIAHLAGAGFQFHLLRPWMVGAKYSYLSSHRRQDASFPGSPYAQDVNGCARLYEIYTRISRVRLSYQNWHRDDYWHEAGDPWYQLPVLSLVSLQWNLIMSKAIDLNLNYIGGVPGNNGLGIEKKLMSQIRLEAVWRFSIPMMEWNAPGTAAENQAVSPRWDDGV